MTSQIEDIFDQFKGLPCTRQEVGQMRSLSLGFGPEELPSPRRNRPYRVWEVGTYDSFWRVSIHSQTVLSKSDAPSQSELDPRLAKIEFGNLVLIRESSATDVRLEMDNGVAIDFLGDPNEDDEFFHVFGPEHLYVGFTVAGWHVGLSKK